MRTPDIFRKPAVLIGTCAVILYSCVSVPKTPPDPRWSDPRIETAASFFEIKVDALRDAAAPLPMYHPADSVTPRPASKTYYIASALRDVPDTDLGFREFATYVENSIKALPVTANGVSRKYHLIRTLEKEKADFLLTLAYGIGSPSTSSDTRVTSQGYGYSVGWMWFTVPPKTQTTTTTTYTRNVIMEMFDLKKPNASMMAKITITSIGTRDDLRGVFPYLIAGTMPWALEGTTTQRSINLYGHNPAILPVLFGY